MSIRLKINQLVEAGELMPFQPRSRRPARRRLYLTKVAWSDLTDSSSAANLLGCRGAIESSLTRWTTGGLVYGDAVGRFLRRLEPPPPEIWEVRVTEPVVQVRLLGRFAEPDTLVLTKFFTRQLLGRKTSPAWKDAMNGCVEAWNSLFGDEPIFTAASIHHYVTENCDEFPI